MKKIFLIFGIAYLIIACKKNSISYHNIYAEASCGQCMFKMEGSGCDLAVKIGEKHYYVVGSTIDDHGDAHANDGFCKAVKNAVISGEVTGNEINISSFKLKE